MKRTFICASSCIKHYVQPSYGCRGMPVVARMCVYTARKFKVWMTIVESGWNVWVWLVGVMSRRRVWLVGEGGIYGCGCKEV